MLSCWLALATEADQRADHHTIYASGLESVAAPQVAVRATRDQPRAWLEVERTSLTTALEQASEQGHAELAGLLALRMSGFLALRAYDDEREHALEVAAAALRGSGPDDLLLKILQALFAVYAQQARCGEMPALAAESLALARKLGDHTRTMRALLHAGLAARRLGRLREAGDMLDEAIRECDPDVPGSSLPSLLVNRAEVHRDLGELALAIPAVERALAIRRAQGNRRLTAMNLIIYAYALIDADRLDRRGARADRGPRDHRGDRRPAARGVRRADASRTWPCAAAAGVRRRRDSTARCRRSRHWATRTARRRCTGPAVTWRSAGAHPPRQSGHCSAPSTCGDSSAHHWRWPECWRDWPEHTPQRAPPRRQPPPARNATRSSPTWPYQRHAYASHPTSERQSSRTPVARMSEDPSERRRRTRPRIRERMSRVRA